MTNEEKLKKIEAVYLNHLEHVTEDVRISFQREDIRWLIDRVKVLTDALELVVTGKPESGLENYILTVAHKALNDTGDSNDK